VPGWRIATLYRAADQASHIGGDFFDLFPTRHGFTVVIGDVTGKGITAATLTALTRYTARAGAMLGQSPAEILSLLNRVLLDQPTLSLVTAVIAQVTDTAGEPQTNIACAGHPLPLRYQSDALPVPLGQPGLLLGLDREAVWSQQTIAIQPGDTLLFYTDGVTDTPGHDDRFGEGRLHAMMAGCPSNPDALVRQIDHALRDFEHGKDGDDIAMLAAQRLPQP
jgi:serine phosphatase RsbU (regulator of sigma subunit)